MKSLFSLLLLICSIHSYGQELPITEQTIKIIDSLKLEIKNDSLLKLDVKSKYWDTTVFNPYKDVVVNFPVRLTFDDSTYTSPISKKKVITSRYGWRRGRAHKGIDIDLVTGDSVVSIMDGVVRFARYNSGHGKTVIVRHYNGLETVYAHLSKYAVKANDSVKKGQLLGKGGATGNARGSHLHLVVSYKGVSINPEYLFGFKENNEIRSQELWVTHKWTRPYLHNSKRQSKIDLLLTEEAAIESLKTKRKIYVVKSGDTLSRISQRNNVSIASICKTNLIKKSSVIRIGQKLVLEI